MNKLVNNANTMWPFKKKDISQTANQRFEDAEAKIRKLEREVLDLASSLDAMRDKLMRKIQKGRGDPLGEEEANERKPASILLPER